MVEGAMEMPDRAQKLAQCFREGVEARLAGRELSDNPYSAGSDERHEWDAGFRASPELDEEDDPSSSRLNERFD